jgi:uncharacterized membrane protein
VFALSLLGAAVAFYLTLAHMNYLALTCGEIAGCAEVAAHPSSRGFGIRGLEYIPTAAFGLAMFLAVAVLGFVRAAAPRSRAAHLARIGQLTMGLSGIAVSAYLTYLEAAVIRAWCQWCILSAIVTVLLGLTLLLERAAPSAPTVDNQNPKSQ